MVAINKSEGLLKKLEIKQNELSAIKKEIEVIKEKMATKITDNLSVEVAGTFNGLKFYLSRMNSDSVSFELSELSLKRLMEVVDEYFNMSNNLKGKIF